MYRMGAPDSRAINRQEAFTRILLDDGGWMVNEDVRQRI